MVKAQCVLFALAQLAYASNATTESTVQQTVITKAKDAQKLIRAGIGGIVNVEIQMYVNFISKINQEDMRYQLGLYLRQTWNDDRLAFNTTHTDYTNAITADAALADRIWRPDAYFVDASSGERQKVSRENVLVKVHPNGDVFLSERFTVTLDCVMSFKNFPFDAQFCPIKLESYAYTTTDLKFNFNKTHAVIYAPSLEMSDFVKGKRYIDLECSNELTTGIFSCVNAYFFIERQVGYYFMYAFLPSVMCVLVSWAGFWIDISSAPARVGLGITSYLSVKTLAQTVNRGMPRVSYVKAIDVWMLGCDFFVFGSIIEFTIAQYMWRRSKSSDNKVANVDGPNSLGFLGFGEQAPGELEQHVVDRVSKRMFPLCFVIFNIAFWSYIGSAKAPPVSSSYTEH